MQLFSAALQYFEKKKKIGPQNIKKPASKVAHNPTRPRDQFGFVELRQDLGLFFFSFLKMSNFAGGIQSLQSLRLALKRYVNADHSTLFSLAENILCEEERAPVQPRNRNYDLLLIFQPSLDKRLTYEDVVYLNSVILPA